MYMPSRFRPFLAALLLAGCASPGPIEQVSNEQDFRTESVVLVIIDGLRYSEGLGDVTGVFTPRMHALAREGAIVEPFLNDSVTRTARAVPAIWSGSWSVPREVDDPACDGGSTIQATAPTVFEYFRKHLDRPAADCVYVLGEVGCPWQPSMVEGYGSEFWPRMVMEGASDRERWDVARTILQTDRPHFLLLYLPDVDHAGHGGDWDAYLEATSSADAIVGELWDTLQSNPQYSGKTTLVVTNDHGRHDDRPDKAHGGFSGHGDGCHGCRTIQLLLVGPDVRPGHVSTVARSIPDIVPTVGSLMGFPTEHATGAAMLELLVAPDSR